MKSYAEFFEKSDEKKRFFSLSAIFANRFSETENYMSDGGIFMMQSQTIRAIAEQGSAIIVGRCSGTVGHAGGIQTSVDVLRFGERQQLDQKFRLHGRLAAGYG